MDHEECKGCGESIYYCLCDGCEHSLPTTPTQEVHTQTRESCTDHMNEIWLLHYQGKLLSRETWSNLKGNTGWDNRFKLRVFGTRSMAQAQVKRFPEAVRKDITVVRYVPEVPVQQTHH